MVPTMTDGACKMPYGKWNMTVPQNFSSAFMEEIPGLVRPMSVNGI
jgi:hypothetical protein